MNKTEKFQSCLEHGKRAEAEIGSFLQSKGFIVEDVSDSPYHRTIDVDLLITNPNIDNTYKLEIKSDSVINRSNNVFVENLMYRKTGTKNSWYHYCLCDVLGYFDDVKRIIYMIDWSKLQPVANTFTNRKFWNTKDECWGSGFLVPLQYILDNHMCFKVYYLNENLKEVS